MYGADWYAPSAYVAPEPFPRATPEQLEAAPEERPSGAAGVSSGIDPETGEWNPVWKGQLAPFRPGNTVSLTHGATSPRRFGPLSEELERRARQSPDWPTHLNSAMYDQAVGALFRTEAKVMLLMQYLSRFEPEQAMTDLVETEETEESEGDQTSGRKRRMSTTKRLNNALEMLRREETLAMNLRSKLGLDPLSFSRIQADVASAKLDLTRIWAQGADESSTREVGGSSPQS
ncbi:hypothetical protein ORV05_04895 [Amycolatopsis cynarae]|uniref:Uncharacterized protein n=1 Tax=Amycolatopsis cynarae TaxID=2995223 RepID=A0ABY7B484_9PSEU|nr:hypothetical protein [Amycolatopsis sp. HUAS 11-8]WAL67129.1 hypothetical protein ORV05_04895 [Amycolatopsis sp. HUAS 11-8]